MRTIVRAVTVSVLLFFSAALAYAADDPATEAPPSSSDLIEDGFDAISKGDWWIAAGAFFSGLFLLARTYGPWKKLLGTDDDLAKSQKDWRGYVGIAVLVITGMTGLALAAHGKDAFNRDLIVAIVKTLAMAQFTYATGKKGLAPLLEGKGAKS